MDENSGELDRLVSEAIDIVMRMQNDPGNPVPVEMARAWRARSDRHEEIWSRVSRIHGASGQLLSERRTAQKRVTRRNVLGGIMAVGGVAGLGSLIVPGALMQARADYMTGVGEIRRIDLPDGSVATLGPRSALALAMSRDERRIDLLMGMCFFDVARDRGRTFTVASGGVSATALGTSFDMSNDAGVVTMAVADGSVGVAVPERAFSETLRLEAGEWMAYDTSSARLSRGVRRDGQIASWRDLAIVADREQVSTLVARISRWIPGKVVTANPAIGTQRVSGLFDLNDPFAALEAAVHPTGARVRRLPSGLTVISPI